MNWSHLGRFLILAGVTIGFGIATAWSIRLGWADYWIRQETVAGTEKAIALIPGQAVYYERLAFLISESEPKRAIEALRQAVALNPESAQSWIELGLQYEQNGDLFQAEKDLLRAAEIDNEYLPRWTLANYYFRQNNLSRFWYWAKQAEAMSYADRQPLFRLCGMVTEDGNLLNRFQITNPDVSASYLSYLLSQNRLDLVIPSSQKVIEEGRSADIPLLLTLCDLFLQHEYVAEAIEIWNKLSTSGRIPFPTRAQNAEPLLVNGQFSVEPTSRGFDWHVAEANGVSIAMEDPSGLRVTFAGNQPENTELLSQYVPVEENRTYIVKFRYRTSNIASSTGVAWHVIAMDGAMTLSGGQSLSSDDEVQGALTFTTPPGCNLVRLTLDYQRSPGTTRIEGFVILRSVEMSVSA